eukprot:TRINITY_DN19208_c0_g1_i1.p1 TRINITY_DN19208_c0_g1~~TRINITY_DN19208_c0_g1_i1.p1  ORF type:complete len:199 (+),score=41.62 TRINITY_DN19208_c0_g1_i1:97-693(+)
MEHLWLLDGVDGSFSSIHSEFLKDETRLEEELLELLESQEMQAVASNPPQMEAFSLDQVTDWKRVVYNQLVHSVNGERSCLIPIKTFIEGQEREGFEVATGWVRKKCLAELYATFARPGESVPLAELDQSVVVVKDLYSHYYRLAEQMMAKYFIKHGNMYLYVDHPLFVSGESLQEGIVRLRSVETKSKNKTAKRKRT